MRVYVLNNYDFDRVTAEIAAGEKPAHHLYGVDWLRSHGWEIVIAPDGPGWVRALGRWLTKVRFPIPLGDLGQQWSVWRNARRGDLVYAPCQTETQLLSYLRASALWNIPIVTLAHHPSAGGRAARLRQPFYREQLRGTDRFPSLSRGVATELRRSAAAAGIADRDFSPVLGWGPDLDYYARWQPEYPGVGVIAAGRTGRDWVTLGRAATETGSLAELVCLRSDVGPDFARFGSNVRVTAATTEADQSYPRLLPRMAKARVLAIPLLSTSTLGGLTSLTDALGLGKPVIMTRHPLIDLDIEAEGIGRWVEAGDVRGWSEALRWFDEHPAEAAAMGRRAAALASARWNYQLFSAQIEALLRDVASGR